MIFNLGGYDNPAASLPSFTYSGTYQLVDDGSSDGLTQNWQLKLLTSGKLKFSTVVDSIDLFLVGGGGAGGQAGGGGGGGYVKTQKVVPVVAGTEYEIVIGAGGTGAAGNGGDGGKTTAFGYEAEGGKGAVDFGLQFIHFVSSCQKYIPGKAWRWPVLCLK